MGNLCIDEEVEMAEAIDLMEEIGEQVWSRPMFLNDAVLCFKGEEKNVRGISSRSLQPVYIRGQISKHAGLTFQLVSEETITKKGLVASAEVRVPRGSGVKADVMRENYETYYKVLQKSMDDI